MSKLLILFVTAFVDMVGLTMIVPILPFYATLRGDAAALAEAYGISATGDVRDWQLSLSPSTAQLGRLVQRIELEGGDGWIDRVLVTETGGDRTDMRLTRSGG